MLINNSEIDIQHLPFEPALKRGITLAVLRLDKVHPVISGNKLFKLHYFLQNALAGKSKKIITSGGAYSNHLVATAYACKIMGLDSIGMVRGEKPTILSHTLQQCIAYGMQLKFISRNEYSNKEKPVFINAIKKEFGEYFIIPEGGYDNIGAKGASLIMEKVGSGITHICCAIGTATTVAGLVMGAKNAQQIIGVPVLKGMTDLDERISFLTENNYSKQQIQLVNEYHFGGYAKATAELYSFMNMLYKEYELPTDFVYTAKMMYAIFDQINNNFFPAGSNILCVHTGGLQGNFSLPKGTLTF